MIEALALIALGVSIGASVASLVWFVHDMHWWDDQMQRCKDLFGWDW